MTANILDTLTRLRRGDAPTHGGSLLSYVYDPGDPDLDRLIAEAVRLTLPVNGLDPTAFPSVAVMERDLIAFARRMLHGHRGRGRQRVFGTITSGGTESCMLAVKTARDLWRAEHPEDPRTPRLVAPMTAHAAFQKAAHSFGLALDLVPVAPDGSVRADDLIARLTEDVALVVVSAPSYPTAQLDPVGSVARAAAARGISCHVDACIGGFALPWWSDVPAWDFRVPGVTSISADFHKFGYAPKGASVLLQRGRTRHRHQFFATRRWPGYPVVNPTLLGSKSATSLAAAWAVANHLDQPGYRRLTGRAERATRAIIDRVRDIPGLRVLGRPTGPLFALVVDERVPVNQRVDPHHFSDAMATHGFQLQPQPGLTQDNGVRIPHSVHLTITPVTESRLADLLPAMVSAANEVRGLPRAHPRLELAALRTLGLLSPDATLTPAKAGVLLRAMGLGSGGGTLPTRMASLMRILEELPAQVAETVLVEVIARMSDPN